MICIYIYEGLKYKHNDLNIYYSNQRNVRSVYQDISKEAEFIGLDRFGWVISGL